MKREDIYILKDISMLQDEIICDLYSEVDLEYIIAKQENILNMLNNDLSPDSYDLTIDVLKMHRNLYYLANEDLAYDVSGYIRLQKDAQEELDLLISLV